MTKSFFQKYGPGALARGLWGRGPVPTRYKILFVGQGFIFTVALWVRTQDVEKAQHLKRLAEAERQREEIRGDESASVKEDDTKR